jgi:hypothetical protein
MRQRQSIAAIVMMTWTAMAGRGDSTTAQTTANLPGWIAGCWSGTRGAERFTERWTAADDTTLIGVAHTVKDGRLSAFEFLRIVVRGDRLVYIAQPNGAPPTEFAATPADQTPAAITFANPQHDSPKRVGYRKTSARGLTAWIDGGPSPAVETSPAGGSRIEYAMTRTPCEP